MHDLVWLISVGLLLIVLVGALEILAMLTIDFSRGGQRGNKREATAIAAILGLVIVLVSMGLFSLLW